MGGHELMAALAAHLRRARGTAWIHRSISGRRIAASSDPDLSARGDLPTRRFPGTRYDPCPILTATTASARHGANRVEDFAAERGAPADAAGNDFAHYIDLQDHRSARTTPVSPHRRRALVTETLAVDLRSRTRRRHGTPARSRRATASACSGASLPSTASSSRIAAISALAASTRSASVPRSMGISEPIEASSRPTIRHCLRSANTVAPLGGSGIRNDPVPHPFPGGRDVERKAPALVESENPRVLHEFLLTTGDNAPRVSYTAWLELAWRASLVTRLCFFVQVSSRIAPKQEWPVPRDQGRMRAPAPTPEGRQCLKQSESVRFVTVKQPFPLPPGRKTLTASNA